MKRTMQRVFSGLIVLAAVCTASLAQAQDNPYVKSRQTSEGYGYEFVDDPLQAGVAGPTPAQIKGMHRAMRIQLIRPRVQFINEMLKSVENL